MFTIPLEGGGVAEFSRQDMVKAFLVAYESATLGTPAEHPLLEAARNSSDPQWRNYLSDLLDDPANEPAKDLSEQALH